MKRPTHEMGMYPHVVFCSGPYDMDEIIGCGYVVLTNTEYNRQMHWMMADSVWKCPKCGLPAAYDDNNNQEWHDRHYPDMRNDVA